MMKILLFGNPVQEALQALGLAGVGDNASWITGFLSQIKNRSDIQIEYIFFMGGNAHRTAATTVEGVTYHMVQLVGSSEALTAEDTAFLKTVVEEIAPDVVHLFGTERKKTLDVLRTVGADKCVISITGLVSVYAKHYFGGIDSRYLRFPTFNDAVRRMSPTVQRKNFERWGRFEREVLAESRYVMGRTTWDYACVKQVNPQVRYFHVGEIMRPAFYENAWDIGQVERHSIFVSQGTYPLKGLHKLMEALPLILAQYPDTRVYVSGADITRSATLLDRVKRTTYAHYLIRQMRRLGVQNRVSFVGRLSEEEMYRRYLSAHVYVLPSIIENSSNSLGEAMLLGVPCVASCVGGSQDLLCDREDGYLYPFDEAYMLAHYVCRIFGDDDTAVALSKAARAHAQVRYAPDKIVEDTVAAYAQIAAAEEGGAE